jgi:hypothetical protein
MLYNIRILNESVHHCHFLSDIIFPESQTLSKFSLSRIADCWSLLCVVENVEAEDRGGSESMAPYAEQSRRKTSLGVRSQSRIAWRARRDRESSRKFLHESLQQKTQFRSTYAHSGMYLCIIILLLKQLEVNLIISLFIYDSCLLLWIFD